MKISENGGGKEFPKIPVGTHVARCIRVIDIGTQEGQYQGEKTRAHKVVIGWELPDELIPDGDYQGQPFFISEFYTASLNEKAKLRGHLANWRGRDFTPEELSGFDLANVLGKPCMISVVLSESGKTKVGGVMALPKGMQVPPQANPTVHFSLDDFNQTVFDGLTKGMKAKIIASPEYQRVVGAGRAPAAMPNGNSISDMEDDIPF
tara:strand:- start:895 stop:1512 length:618 start_codon:yes stop_codon:yes gene_type:complete